jgi:5'-nucleotidase
VKDFIAGLAANILATSEVPLNGLRGQVATGTENITTPGVRNSETNLGNLTADSMLWQAQQLASTFGVDSPQIGLQNGGGIRNDSVIPAGPISELNTFQILAFTNFVSVKEDLTPDQLKAVLETSVSQIGNGRFGQWSGIEFTYSISAQRRTIDPNTCVVSTDLEGDRIQDVFVEGVQIFDDGAFVGPAGWTVDVATNDFTFRGGDCYDFGDGGFTTVGVTYQQALVNYLTDGLAGVISAADYPVGGEGRIEQVP